MFPSILRPLLRAANAHGVRAVRNPFEAAGVVSLGEAFSNRTLLIRKAETTVLRTLFSRRWMRDVHEAGLTTTDGSLGVATTGTMDEARLCSMLERMPEGIWELVCHPGYNDQELQKVRTKLRASREVELAALTALNARELHERYGVELLPFEAQALQPAASGNI